MKPDTLTVQLVLFETFADLDLMLANTVNVSTFYEIRSLELNSRFDLYECKIGWENDPRFPSRMGKSSLVRENVCGWKTTIAVRLQLDN